MKKNNFILACIIIIINLLLIFTIIISVKIAEKKLQEPKLNKTEFLNSDKIGLFKLKDSTEIIKIYNDPNISNKVKYETYNKHEEKKSLYIQYDSILWACTK